MPSKAELRGLVRARCGQISPQERRSLDRILIERFLALPEYLNARSVLLYAGVEPEPDTRPILEDALSRGKRTALPKITGRGAMEARRIASPDGLVPGAFGIPEPGDGSEPVSPEEFDLILVPGAAFTRGGARLGRGGGYYDRYLPRTRGVKAALARPWEVLTDLPKREHDVNIDILITL